MVWLAECHHESDPLRTTRDLPSPTVSPSLLKVVLLLLPHRKLEVTREMAQRSGVNALHVTPNLQHILVISLNIKLGIAPDLV